MRAFCSCRDPANRTTMDALRIVARPARPRPNSGPRSLDGLNDRTRRRDPVGTRTEPFDPAGRGRTRTHPRISQDPRCARTVLDLGRREHRTHQLGPGRAWGHHGPRLVGDGGGPRRRQRHRHDDLRHLRRHRPTHRGHRNGAVAGRLRAPGCLRPGRRAGPGLYGLVRGQHLDRPRSGDGAARRAGTRRSGPRQQRRTDRRGGGHHGDAGDDRVVRLSGDLRL